MHGPTSAFSQMIAAFIGGDAAQPRFYAVLLYRIDFFVGGQKGLLRKILAVQPVTRKG